MEVTELSEDDDERPLGYTRPWNRLSGADDEFNAPVASVSTMPRKATPSLCTG